MNLHQLTTAEKLVESIIKKSHHITNEINANNNSISEDKNNINNIIPPSISPIQSYSKPNETIKNIQLNTIYDETNQKTNVQCLQYYYLHLKPPKYISSNINDEFKNKSTKIK